MKTILLVLALGGLALSETVAAPAPNTNDVLFADFEGDTWGGWEVTGTAFGTGPARGALTNQQPVTGFVGRGLVNSFVGGDKSTGTLTSPEFTIEKPYLNFLIGGGNRPGKLCINLVIDGKVVKSATGVESERLLWHTWQLFPVMKKKARLQIVDDYAAGWGHINIDNITFTDRPKVPPFFNDAATRAMTSLAEATPRAAKDPLRPIFHFHPPANWMNDPNGTIYYGGYYHMYYQHNPFGDQWGHMHWGHARSRDLVNWKHMPVALWPSKEHDEDHVFSGCATTNINGEFLAFYTSIGRGKSAGDYAEQWVGLGDAEGNTFVKHPANPVLTEKLHGDLKVYDWRDPFIFREAGNVFLVCGGNLNKAKGGEGVVLLYEAANGELTKWKFRGVMWKHPDAAAKDVECPNFFKLGDRWVLVVSPYGRVEYFTGDFDALSGKFTARDRGLMDHSGDFYAPNVLEDPKGRRVMWGWLRGFPEGRGWNGCLTIARILTMGADGHLRQSPAPEMEKIRTRGFELANVGIKSATNYMENVKSDALEIIAEFDPGDAKQFGLRLRTSDDGARSVNITFDGTNLDVAGAKAVIGSPGSRETLRLHIFLDKSVLEVYANGRECITRVIKPDVKDLGVALFASGGTANLKKLQAWPLNGIRFD